jgi:integrase
MRNVVGTSKNGKSREVPLSDDAIAILRSLPSCYAHLPPRADSAAQNNATPPAFAGKRVATFERKLAKAM